MDVLGQDQIEQRLATVPGWTRQGDAIVHEEKLADFKTSMLFASAVAYLAEAANHHPDIAISWDTVTLTLSTHSAGGLTDRDFALASQISQLPRR